MSNTRRQNGFFRPTVGRCGSTMRTETEISRPYQRRPRGAVGSNHRSAFAQYPSAQCSSAATHPPRHDNATAGSSQDSPAAQECSDHESAAYPDQDSQITHGLWCWGLLVRNTAFCARRARGAVGSGVRMSRCPNICCRANGVLRVPALTRP